MDDSTTYTVLGRYRLLRRIGRGGMGEVWLAEDPRLRRQVALKVLPTRKRDDQEFLLRFEREARAAAALHHPHILPVHDYGQQQLPGDQTVTYLVMSYVSGGSVEDRLKQLASQQQPLSQDEALAYLSQVAEAIDYAHAHGIIHRDIKPANMLLREDNWLLLTDFGIARILTDTDAATATGAYLGTPTYMAPEQAQGHAQPASDIYSLAIVAYQLFAGRVPFQADNPYAVTFQHAFAAPPSPRLYNPALSPEFETALLRGMAKDPAQRPPSATAYVTSLRQALEMQRALLSTPAQGDWQAEPARPAPRLTRRKVLLGAGAGALLIGGGATAYVLSTQAHHGPTLSSTPTAGARASVTVSSGFSAPLTLASVFNSPVTHMAWSPVTNVLVMQGSDSTNQDNGLLTLWTMPAAGQISTPQKVAQQSFFLSIGSGFFPVWSPDGKILALGNGGFDAGQTETLFYTANLSGTVPGIPATAIKAPGGFQGMCWASNEYLVTVESDAGISQAFLKIWNVRHPQQKPITVTLNHQLPLDAIGNFNVLALAPDGSTLGVGTQDGMLLGRLNPASQSSAWQLLLKNPLTSNNMEVDELAWTRDGRYLAGLDASSNQVGIWDTTQQYKPVQPGLDMSKITGQVTHIAWSPTSRNPLLALGVTQGLVYLWDVRGGAAALRTLPGNLENQIKALCWSFDGHWLAASYNDPAASILFWRM
jgi:serine/threonine protein kinase